MDILSTVQDAIAGQNAVKLVLIALFLALVMLRIAHVVVYALIAVLIHYFGYLALRLADGSALSDLGDLAGYTFNEMVAAPLAVLVLYVFYAVLISFFFLVRSLLFRGR